MIIAELLKLIRGHAKSTERNRDWEATKELTNRGCVQSSVWVLWFILVIICIQKRVFPNPQALKPDTFNVDY